MKKPENRGVCTLIGLLSIVSIGLFLVPAFIIRPFKYQAPRALRLAILLKDIAPPLTLLIFAIMFAIGIYLWRNSSILIRAGIVVALLLATVSAVMVRQNYFEWMFNPIKAAGFFPAGTAKLDDKEMVMVVRIADDARAYPIVQMAYHHVLNDTVDGVPIVVTY